MISEKKIDNYIISNDRAKLDVNYIHYFLSEESYWAKNIPIELVKTSIEGSFCFGVYHQGKQIGFGNLW